MDDREYHSHTYQSDDASQSLQELLDNGFQKYGLIGSRSPTILEFLNGTTREILLPADLFRSPWNGSIPDSQDSATSGSREIQEQDYLLRL